MTEHELRPNVIWVFGDQHRGQSVGYMGDPNVATPNLDRLAAEGLTFTHAVAGAPLCTPARSAIMTGRYPHKGAAAHEDQLPSGQPTLATPFRQAGYRTSYFGKWHLDGFHETRGRAAMHIVPPERRGGFEIWVGYENNNSQWDSWVHGGTGDSAFHHRLPAYETDALTDLLVADIAAAAGDDRPFFAVLAPQPPHDPYIAPPDWMRRHTPGQVRLRPNVPEVPRVTERARRELAGYHAMIENLDWNLGRIRTSLEAHDLSDSTHVVFFSDHGDLHGSHGQFLKTAPWEEAIRVPLVIGGATPRYVHRSGRVSAPVNQVDLAPTSLGLCGIPVPDWMDGTDYSRLRLVDDAPSGRAGAAQSSYESHRSELPDSAFAQIVVPTGHPDSVDRSWRAVVTDDGWKYVALEGVPWLMFDLNEDPYELINLGHNTRYREQRQRLHDRLGDWIRDTGDPFRLGTI